MAKTFGGFTPQQQQTLLSKMGYTGPAQQDDLNKYMMSSPKAASMMGKYAQMAKARVAGGPTVGMAAGGIVPWSAGEASGYAFGGKKYNSLAEAQQAQAAQQAQTTPIQTTPTQTAPTQTAPTQTAPTNVTSSTPTPNTTGGTAAGGIVPWSSGEASGYEFGGKKYSSLAEAQQAEAAQANVTSSTTESDGPPIDWSFDETGLWEAEQRWADQRAAKEAERVAQVENYDPTAGLPEIPVDPITEEKLKEYTSGIPSWANKVKDLFSSGEIPEDTTDWKVTGGRRNYTLEFKDGTKIPLTGLNRYDTEQPVIQGIVDNLEKIKAERSVYNEQKSIYDKQLDIYKQYQSGQAGAGLDDTRAELDTAQRNLAQEQNLLRQYDSQLANMDADDPQRSVIEGLIEQQKVKTTNAEANLSQAQTNVERVGMPSTTEMRADILDDPMSMVTTAEVAKVTDAQRESGKMAAGTGQAGTAATAGTVTAAKAGDVVAPEVKAAATFTAEQTAQQVQDTLDKLVAVTGKPSAEALADAQTMDPTQLAQLGLTVEQIQQAVTVQAPDARTLQEGELVSGPSVDFERAKAETNFAAATGVPSTEATVQGQLTGLLEQFEGGETPPWAAGAMRAATATLAARGLGASSMAGQAVVQAAMESAMPIAMADAQTRASFEAQNLSNRQQAAMFAAEQRSKFLGMEFDQEFQTRVQNASRIADIANINFSAEQQIALENARMAQTVDVANLQAKNAKIMADAAAMSQLDITNLNNRQQSAVQNAQSFLQMDMTNLSNQQQVAVFKAQGNIQSIITDAAAANAAAQFNASSENQTNQFYDNLVTQVAQFNNEQSNAMERFNADQANAIAQFNAAQKNARDEFNAKSALVVEQANAQWEQSITTMENAAQNAANRDAAMAANNLTEATYNNMLQQERDVMDYAWRTVDNALARDSSLTIAEMQTQAQVDQARGSGVGTLLNTVVTFAAKKIFS